MRHCSPSSFYTVAFFIEFVQGIDVGLLCLYCSHLMSLINVINIKQLGFAKSSIKLGQVI